MSEPKRPALRWHGGKWRLAQWINAQFPPHRTYVEPFGGAASVLIQKPRAYAEVYNDLDDEVVTFFRVLRDPVQSARLVELLALTPFARSEFRAAYEPTQDPVERARRLAVRSFMGFGSNAHASQANGHRSTGFRANSNRSGTTPAMDWQNYPAALTSVIERWRGVVVEHRDAFEIMAQHDRPDALFYCDPPYMHGLRAPSGKVDLRSRMYRHEMDDPAHATFLKRIRELSGMVVVSGYASPLYDDALKGWARLTRDTHADGARERTEVLWINPQACARSDAPQFRGLALCG